MRSLPAFQWFQCKPLRRLVTIRSSNVDKVMEEGEDTVRLCNYVDVYYNDRITGSLEFSEGSAKPREIAKFGLRTGDVVITKDSETPDDIAVPALVEQSAEGIVCGYHLAILRPIEGEVHGPYLYWSLMAKPTREAFGIAAQGVTRFGLTLNGIASVPIPLPDFNTQKAIAAFLDRETGRIDKLIAKKEHFADSLAERKVSVVSEVFARNGAPSTCLSASNLAPSNLQNGWSVQKLKHTVDFMTSGSRGWSEYLADQGELFLQSGNIDQDMEINLDSVQRIVPQTGAEAKRTRLKANDILICITGGRTGAVGYLPEIDEPAYINQHVCLLRAKRTAISPELLAHLLYSEIGQSQIGMLQYGMKQGLGFAQLKEIVLPIPPVGLQDQILQKTRSRVAEINNLRRQIRLSVELLLERRAALITAAVTGQIDVRKKLPAITTKPDYAKFRVIVGAEIIHRHQGNPKFGHVKLQKLMYLAEAHSGISELQGNYMREAAGPYDRALIESLDRSLEANGFYRATKPEKIEEAVTYTPLAKAGQHSADLKALLGTRAQGLRSLIGLMSDFEKHSVEAIATLYAVWNDAIMDGEPPDDAAIINGVLTEWHSEKGEKFKDADLRHWLDWMKRNRLTPRGEGPRTAPTMTRSLF